MDIGGLRAIVNGALLPDVASCRAELEHIRVARSVLDARELFVLARLDELAAEQPSVFPEEEVAKAAKTSLGKASKVRSRKKACDDVPELAAALAEGDTTGDRVDQVARATAGLSAEELAKVAAQGAQLAAAAAAGSDRQFKEAVERIVGRARSDDGLERLARQRRDSRMRWWTGADGMWNFSGRLDPVRGVELEGRLQQRIEALFRGPRPDDAPADPVEFQEHLAVSALIQLTTPGAVGPSGLPEVVVLIDAETFLSGRRHDGTVIDAGSGRFGIPVETIRRWACLGAVAPVVVAADGTRIYLGREARVANRAQRRALRVLYRSCALCDTPFERCQAHHVAWHGRDLGPTDIDNLVPLCDRHHHLVHEGGWQLHLAADRTLTVTRPGGHRTTHGPPRARAA